TTASHDRSDLILRRFKLVCRVHLNECDDRTSAAVRFLISRIWNVDHVVAREAEDRAQRFEDAKDQIWSPVDPEFLAQRPVSRCVGKQILQHVRTDNTDITSGCAFTLGPN